MTYDFLVCVCWNQNIFLQYGSGDPDGVKNHEKDESVSGLCVRSRAHNSCILPSVSAQQESCWRGYAFVLFVVMQPSYFHSPKGVGINTLQAESSGSCSNLYLLS